MSSFVSRILLLLLFPATTFFAQTPSAVKDSVGGVLPVRGKAFEKTILSDLNTTRKAFQRGRKTPDYERRLINAQLAMFRAMSNMALVLDRQHIYHAEVKKEQQLLLSRAGQRAEPQKQLLSSITGIYTMYNVVYKLAFVEDTVKIGELVAIHDSIVHSIQGSMQLFQALNTFSKSIYSMSRSVVQAVDSTGHLAGAIVQYDKLYEDGEKIALDEEDRFLNSVYRTFHMHELWAIYSAPPDQRKASLMSTSLFTDTRAKSVESKVEQIVIAMEYLYRITDRLVLNLLRLFL